MNTATTIGALLNAFWLRPETALWRELDIRAMNDFEFLSPSIDLGCGDGLFSFIRAGGRLSPKFDAFQVVAGLDSFFSNVDVFDAYDPTLALQVVSEPKYKIDVAFDHKENLLRKASHLGLYRDFKVGDANQQLPFADESFSTLFSNIVYWLDDPSSVLSEIARILKKNGRACLMLPNHSLPRYSYYKKYYVDGGRDPKWAFLEKLDRGRFDDNIRQSRSGENWEFLFQQAGLKVARHSMHLSKPVIQMWDIGLRPLFPLLKKMADSLPKDEFERIKSEWVATLHQFVAPIAELDSVLSVDSEPAFHCYVLEK